MSRVRVHSPNAAVYVGQTPVNVTDDPRQILLANEASHSYSIEREDIQILGQRRPIRRVNFETPTVSVDFSYMLSNGLNESRLGFVVDGTISFISRIADKTEDEKNFYFLTVPEGRDAIGNTDVANHNVYAFGNCYLTSYAVEASLNEAVMVNVSAEGLNVNYDIGSADKDIPAINPETGEDIIGETYTLPVAQATEGDMPVVLRHADIEVNFSSNAEIIPGIRLVGGVGDGTGHIQDLSIEVSLDREPIERFGSRYAFSRELEDILPVTLNITAIRSEIQEGKLSDIIRACDEDTVDCTVIFRECDETPLGGDPAMTYELRGLTIDEQSLENSVGGGSETATLTFTANLGGEEDVEGGLFVTAGYDFGT